MKNKEPLRIKIIRRFYGIEGDYDEYKEKEVNRIGNNAFMGLWWYFLVANFIACIFVFKYPVQTLWVYIGINLFVSVFVVCTYLMIASQKSKLNDVEVEKMDFQTAKKKVLRSGILAGLYFGISMYFLGALINWVSENETVVSYIHTPRNLIISIFQAIFFGGFMYAIGRSRIKKQTK
ncbi:hypothetical protein DJZ09_01909 [Streptococcus infantarius subsp. infantarius]|nr:hypothetical protein [Streptococcus infantarius subsp. infantarius]